MRNQLSEVVSCQQMDENALRFLEAAGFAGAAVRGLAPGRWIARNPASGQEHQGRLF